VLSLQLPFALVPLIRFTSSRRVMGEYVNTRAVSVVAGVAAALVIACNGWLVMQTAGDHLPPSLMIFAMTIGLGAAGLLAYLALVPLRAPDDSFDEPLRDVLPRREGSPEYQPL
jgi:manganese transport protein